MCITTKVIFPKLKKIHTLIKLTFLSIYNKHYIRIYVCVYTSIYVIRENGIGIIKMYETKDWRASMK